MTRRHSTVVLALTVVWTVATATVVSAHHDDGSHEAAREISAEDSNAHLLDPAHHGPNIGHLPSEVENVDLVSRLKLTDVEGGIADVGYYKGYAYLNAWFPECTATGGSGGGVHIVDVSNPANPVKVGFLPSEANAVPGEGIHIMTVNTPSFQGDLLLHNNEQCDGTMPADLGMSIWDVTNPLSPTKLSQWGDEEPDAGTTYHSIHSVQGWTQPGKAFAVMVDNIEFPDVDIVDITNPAAPVMASETDLSDWPDAQAPLANGSAAFLHDMQFKRIGGNDYLALSYWDAGQIILNVNDPANPVFVGDSDYIDPDPETGHTPAEGNSHESYWSSNNQFLLSTDEDFTTFRLEPPGFEITTGPDAGGYEGGEFSFTVPISSRPGGMVNGSTVFGGRGCVADGDPAPPTAASIEAANPGFWGAGEEKTIVFSRGLCFFSDKVFNGEDAGYDAVVIGNSHAGSGNGSAPDAAFCGGQGSPVQGIASGLCVGHRAMHLLFGDTPEYTGADGVDIPLGELGEEFQASAVFDGWGYVQLHDATQPNLPILDTYVIREALDSRYAQGFGDLTVHEVKTDPRPNVNLAYFSWYSGGFRVAEFGPGGINEVGVYIADEGNDFWGVFPIGDEYAGHGYANDQPYTKPLVLASDRSFGLYIFQYAGSAGICGKAEVTALGTSAADVIPATKGNDVVNALDGNDRVKGGKGRDRLCGGKGKDRLKGGPGRDLLIGGPGKDRLVGGPGQDLLIGGPGKKDVCIGGPGKDKFRGCEKKKQ